MARSRLLRSMIATALAVGVGVAASTNAWATNAYQDTDYQLDTTHDGHLSHDPLTFPLQKLWDVQLSGSVAAPLVVNGVVYVLAATADRGSNLYAIDLATGTTDWVIQLPATGEQWAGISYDVGHIYALSSQGTGAGNALLNAYDADTGTLTWSTEPNDSFSGGAPTARDGQVYAVTNGSRTILTAVFEANGLSRWNKLVWGDQSSPAVNSKGVYVTFPCDQDYGFSPLAGTPVLRHNTSCDGGGGAPAVVADGRLFSEDTAGLKGNIVLSTRTGKKLGNLNLGVSGITPIAVAVAHGLVYSNWGKLTATRKYGLGSIAWRFSGDGGLGNGQAPIINGDVVFAGSTTGELYALNALSGTQVWSTNVGHSIYNPDAGKGFVPAEGLGVGDKAVLVPAGSNLVAYGSADASDGATHVPMLKIRPNVQGPAYVGVPVGVDAGLWSPIPSTLTYQWQLCDRNGEACQNIDGATDESYSPSYSQRGSTLRVQVQASDPAGTSAIATSHPSAVITEGRKAEGAPRGTPGMKLITEPRTVVVSGSRQKISAFGVDCVKPANDVKMTVESQDHTRDLGCPGVIDAKWEGLTSGQTYTLDLQPVWQNQTEAPQLQGTMRTVEVRVVGQYLQRLTP